MNKFQLSYYYIVFTTVVWAIIAILAVIIGTSAGGVKGFFGALMSMAVPLVISGLLIYAWKDWKQCVPASA